MTQPEQEPDTSDENVADASLTEAEPTTTDQAGASHEPPHPPFARSPDDYTDPPGHHRRGPHGPALDVGA
jgi:hypothetical protein